MSELECEDCKFCNLNKYYRGEWYCNNPKVSIFDLTVDPGKCFEKREQKGRVMSRVLPILFNTDMVLATLDKRKTATRRLVRFLPGKNPNWTGYVKDGLMLYNGKNEPCCRKAPYQPGDILYVRETWSFIPCIECTANDCCDKIPSLFEDKDTESECCYIYRAGFPEYTDPKRITWRPSIHMPKEAARIWLKVTDVRVERLQDMKLIDFLDEGVVIRPEAFNDPDNAYMQAKNEFIAVWDSTIPKRQQDLYSWAATPWVWVIEFERCEKPESEER